MSVTAKFKVQSVTENVAWGYDEVLLVPDYAQGRNKDWAAATPSGTIRMNVGRDTEAIKQFTQGRVFMVTFDAEDE